MGSGLAKERVKLGSAKVRDTIRVRNKVRIRVWLKVGVHARGWG